MSFYVKEFSRSNQKTMELIRLWWQEQTNGPIGSTCMSDYGFMVFNSSDRPIAAIFIYPVLGADFALMGFPIANSNIEKTERREALSYLTTQAENAIRKLNYQLAVSYAGSDGAKGLFKRLGYEETDKDVILFLKDLKNG